MMGRRTIERTSLAVLIAAACLCLGFGRTGLPGGTIPIGDRKAFHGSNCRAMNSDEVVYYDQKGSYHNQSSQTLMCPLFRDVLGGGSDLNHISVELDVNGTAGFTECTAFTMTEDGDSSGLILDFATSSSNSAGDISHNFYLADTSSGNEGTYWVECEIGTYDDILHIYVNEG